MKNIRLLSWNVNGFRAVYKKGFADWLVKESPDILCLQETKAEEGQIREQLDAIKGYHWCFNSAEKKGYSGVAVFSKEKPLNIEMGMGHPPFDNEGRTIIATYPGFVLYNIYFPNGKSRPERLKYKMDFYDFFLNHVVKAKQEGKGVIICGDVNTAHKEIDLARPKENSKISGFLPEERAWMDIFVAAGFIDTLRMFHPEPGQYSWWDMQSGARARNVGWRIDYFFVSENLKDKVKKAFILPEVMGSDHCPVGMELVQK